MGETTGAAGFCPRCGQVVGTWHTKPMCDAAYDNAYTAARTPVTPEASPVTGAVPGLDEVLAASRRVAAYLAELDGFMGGEPVEPALDYAMGGSDSTPLLMADLRTLAALPEALTAGEPKAVEHGCANYREPTTCRTALPRFLAETRNGWCDWCKAVEA
jgi:hypothetical protein